MHCDSYEVRKLNMLSLVYSSNALHFLFPKKMEVLFVVWKILRIGLDAELKTNKDLKRIKGNYFIPCRLPAPLAYKVPSRKSGQMLWTLT